MKHTSKGGKEVTFFLCTVECTVTQKKKTNKPEDVYRQAKCVNNI